MIGILRVAIGAVRLRTILTAMLAAVCCIIVGVDASLPSPNKVASIETNCTRDAFQIKMNLGKPFKGIIFAKDFSEECRARGNHTNAVVLVLPTAGCGVRSQPAADGMLELSVRIVVQMDSKLQQRADVEKTAKCMLRPDMMSMSVAVATGSDRSSRNGRMKSEDTVAEPPRARIWLELGGADGTGSVEVGEPTTLDVRAVLPPNIGVHVIDCAALDGLGESSQKLLDDRGCPVDEQVMPALHKRVRATRVDDEPTQTHQTVGQVEKLFTATFPAFKFPDRERLHVSCGVQLCNGKCPNVDCSTNDPFHILGEQQLARIEVFNSLAVTAPQIELDRPSELLKNQTEDAWLTKRAYRTEGTLCMSTSKLAFAFCTLGLIFLVAVVVAICCLLRARMKNRRTACANSTSIFSSSSSSHSRFGSKLLIPYGGTLPYGRVY